MKKNLLWVVFVMIIFTGCSYKEGEYEFNKAVKHGSHITTAFMYSSGFGVEQDEIKGFELYKKYADDLSLSKLYEKGYTEMKYNYRESGNYRNSRTLKMKLPDSEKNNPNRYKIAFDYYVSSGDKEKDLTLLTNIVSHFSDSELENLVEREPLINYVLGSRYFDRNNLEMAAKYFDKIPPYILLVDRDNSTYLKIESFRKLANKYLERELPNPKLTLKYYDIVCSMGDKLFCLDFKEAEQIHYDRHEARYLNNKLISITNIKNLMKIFAAQGNSEALYIIADYAEYIPNQESLTIFKKLSAEGHLKSTYRLAKYYESGTLIKQDLQKAKSIYGQICDKGYKPACVDYKRINEKGF